MLNRMLGLAAVAALTFTAGHARAATGTGLSAAFDACTGKAQGAIEQAACLTSETERQDRRLNQAYKQLQGRLDSAGKTRLVAAQRSWLQWRESEGALETALYDSNPVGNLQQARNDAERLRARADQLEAYLRLVG